MDHPRWIGAWPEAARFAPTRDQGERVLYLRHADPRGYEVVQVNRSGDQVGIHAQESLPGPIQWRGDHGLFLWDSQLHLALDRPLAWGDPVAEARWESDQAFVFSTEEGLYHWDLDQDRVTTLAELVAENPPQEPKGFLGPQQDRLFPVVKEREDEKRERKDRKNPRIYYGKNRELIQAHLSPSGNRVLVVDGNKRGGKKDRMPVYVTRSGFVDLEKVREKVADVRPSRHRLRIYDLRSGAAVELESPAGKKRPIRVEQARWSRDGRLALSLFTQDFKDRWLMEVDFKGQRLVTLDHLHDEAWIPWSFNEFGWTHDGAFWFLSEKTGYSQLYLREQGVTRALTRGRHEVASVKLSPDGSFYYTANAERPTRFDVYRTDRQGRTRRVSDLGGLTEFDLSRDGRTLLLMHSKTHRPPELYLQAASPGKQPRPITRITRPEFLSVAWTEPQIVEVPSRHQTRPIYSRLYSPGDASARRPGVIFVHGAGYLQDAHEGWSYYFREFMFHSLLNQSGVVVLDMDYRASAGYGRDWRTAIYGRMGHPELQDLEDGVRYLVEHHQVDPERVGIYGGSYGGFMTLMALFKSPGTFACGAALRPVTDWAHYNFGYTGRILNLPKDDQEAYRLSSPIEWAEGLQDPLLMCHGMLDDNVLAQDTIRLAQRLIELKKENWEMALYPVEPHSFIEPSSWLDEYRRIHKLFKQHLRLP